MPKSSPLQQCSYSHFALSTLKVAWENSWSVCRQSVSSYKETLKLPCPQNLQICGHLSGNTDMYCHSENRFSHILHLFSLQYLFPILSKTASEATFRSQYNEHNEQY